jgi:hypothetical protein
MKTILVLFAFTLLSLSAPAQDAQEPTTPSYCKPCLFYGGDFDPSGPSPNVLSNADNLSGVAAVYVPFAVPPNETWTVAGLFSNDMSPAAAPVLDPPQIQWSISTGISQNNAGTVIASGTAKASLTPTGRSWNGMNEYTALGLLNANETVTLVSGHYWMTAVPVCTFVGSRAPCSNAYFYLSDVEDVPAPHAVGFESTDESYWNVPGSQTFNFVETGGPSGICDQPGNGGGCDKFSVGLIGRAQRD